MLGVGLGAYRGPAITLFDRLGFPIEGLRGVEDVFCALRSGDSGLGKEGLFAFIVGLDARPGPMDLLSFGAAAVNDGGGCGCSIIPFDFGVPPFAVNDGDRRRYALFEGKNIPAPLIEVVK